MLDSGLWKGLSMNLDKKVGVGITPAPNSIYLNTLSDIVLDKRILFDWLSYTFDSLTYHFSNKGMKYFLSDILADDPQNYIIVSKLFKLLGADKDWNEYELSKSGLNNYKYTVFIGEHIQLLFFGPVNKYDNHTAQILLTGQGCRDFLEFRGGSYYTLFNYLLEFPHHAFKRLDLSIDDFTGNEINPYFVLEYIQKGYFTTSFRSLNTQRYMKTTDEAPEIVGFALTFGTRPSTVFQMYDKMLERENKGELDFHSQVHYRYEMRFTDEKAEAVVKAYCLAYEELEKNPSSISEFALGCLSALIELKTPEKDWHNRPRWKMLPSWEKFLNSVKKVDLNPEKKIENPLNLKKEWYYRSLRKLVGKLFCSDEDGFFTEMLYQIGLGITGFSEKDKASVNSNLVSRGLPQKSTKNFEKIAKNLLALQNGSEEERQSTIRRNDDPYPQF